MRWIVVGMLGVHAVGCGEGGSSDGSGSGSDSVSSESAGTEATAGSASGTGSQQDCGAPGYSLEVVTDGSPTISVPDGAAGTTDVPDGAGIGGSLHVPVDGFEIPQETQLMMTFFDLVPGTLAAGDDVVTMLYRELPAADEPRPADVELFGPVAGTLVVHAVAAAEGDPVCAQFDLVIDAQRQLEISGHFNFAYEMPDPGPG